MKLVMISLGIAAFGVSITFMLGHSDEAWEMVGRAILVLIGALCCRHGDKAEALFKEANKHALAAAAQRSD